MSTISDVKDSMVKHLLEIDKTKLSMMDLRTYCEIVSMMDTLYKPDFNSHLAELMNVFNSNSAAQYRPVELKEE